MSIPTLLPTTSPILSPTQQPTSTTTTNGYPTSFPSYHGPSTFPSSFPTSMPTSFPTYIYGIPCPSGEGSTIASDPFCYTCPAGSYSTLVVMTNTNFSSCSACPINQYQPNTGSISCLNCPAGKITGSLGTVLQSSCVNPTINFVSGGICLFFAVVVIMLYLYSGRLLCIAIYRKKRLVEKSITICGAAARSADLVTTVANIMSTVMLRRKQKEKDRDHSRHMVLKQHLWKPALFVVLAIIIVVLQTFGTLLVSLFHMLFNVLLLQRSYSIFVKLSLTFEEQVNLLLSQVALNIGIPKFSLFLYPFRYFSQLLTVLSKIQINFSNVQVTCAGSQAPIYLLTYLLIFSVVIIIIQSNLQVFWISSLSPAINKASNLIFSRYFFIRNKSTSMLMFLICRSLLFIPQPRTIVQYMIGFISWSYFFQNQGVATSTSNCDAATTIPLDTILAIATTIMVVLALFPVLYIVAQVLVPCFKRGELKRLLKELLPKSIYIANKEEDMKNIDQHGEENESKSPVKSLSFSSKITNVVRSIRSSMIPIKYQENETVITRIVR
jgi:hypothetical protein